MLDTVRRNKIYVAFIMLLVLAQAVPAHARSGHGRSRPYRYHHVSRPYPAYGKIVAILPAGYVSVVIGSSRYHYCDGVYYRKVRGHYAIVAPPSGAYGYHHRPHYSNLCRR